MARKSKSSGNKKTPAKAEAPAEKEVEDEPVESNASEVAQEGAKAEVQASPSVKSEDVSGENGVTDGATARDPVAPSSGSDLEAENASLRAQLEEYKRLLRQKDNEIQQLRSQEGKGLSSKGSNMEDLEVLQRRLAELKEQQQKADAQRDSAWKELRRVIEEVSNLADSSKTAMPVS